MGTLVALTMSDPEAATAGVAEAAAGRARRPA